MKKINYLFLSLALATVISLALIGIAIAERSIIGIILSILATVFVTGYGFKLKKKMRTY